MAWVFTSKIIPPFWESDVRLLSMTLERFRSVKVQRKMEKNLSSTHTSMKLNPPAAVPWKTPPSLYRYASFPPRLVQTCSAELS